MGMLTNVLLFIVVISTGLFFLNPYVGAPNSATNFINTTLLDNYTVNASANSQPLPGRDTTDYPFLQVILVAIGGAIAVMAIDFAASILRGTSYFPNPYVIFSVFMGTMLLQLLATSYDLLAVLPYPLNVFLITVFGVIIIWGIIAYFHGTGEP